MRRYTAIVEWSRSMTTADVAKPARIPPTMKASFLRGDEKTAAVRGCHLRDVNRRRVHRTGDARTIHHARYHNPRDNMFNVPKLTERCQNCGRATDGVKYACNNKLATPTDQSTKHIANERANEGAKQRA